MTALPPPAPPLPPPPPPLPLRPLTLGEVLDISFGLYRSMFPTLLVVAVCVHLLPTLVEVYLTSSTGMYSLWPLTLAYFFLTIVLGSLGVAATTHVISEAYLGRRITAGQALLRAVPLIWRLIVISFLSSLLIGIGFMLLIVPGLILLSGLLLSSAIMVVEHPPGPVRAMARSWQLTSGYRGKVFGTILLAFLLLMVPSMAIGGIWALVRPMAFNSPVPQVVTALVQVLVYPYLYTVITLVYYDLRIRKEGFDLELLSEAAGQSA